MPFKWDRVLRPRCLTRFSQSRLMDDDHGAKSLNAATSESSHFRQIDPLPTLSACPLRSDRVRTFAPQRFDAVC